MNTTAPTLAPATVTREDDGSITVRVEWAPQADLDRLDAYAWGLPARHAALAERLRRAVDAGVVVRPTVPYTDVTGRRGWHTTCTILARTMNADLRRLGY